MREHQIIDGLVRTQKRLQEQIVLKDPSTKPLYDAVWESIWKSLREMADQADRPGLEGVLFTIQGGFNICEDFVRSECYYLVHQAFSMTLAYSMPDDLQHRMDDCIAAAGVKIADIGLGSGKTEIRRQP